MSILMPGRATNSEVPFLKNGIAQVCLIVEDLDRAVENYWKLFGIGPWHFYTYGKPLVKKIHLQYLVGQ